LRHGSAFIWDGGIVATAENLDSAFAEKTVPAIDFQATWFKIPRAI
jgi:hypothetical protein